MDGGNMRQVCEGRCDNFEKKHRTVPNKAIAPHGPATIYDASRDRDVNTGK